MAKDPKRQLLGKIARQKGQYFEQRLDSTFDYYRERGYAEIEKTPEPMTMPKQPSAAATAISLAGS